MSSELRSDCVVRYYIVHSAAMADPAEVPTVAVYVTVPDKETGKKVAAALIESKLAACVNMIPGTQSWLSGHWDLHTGGVEWQ